MKYLHPLVALSVAALLLGTGWPAIAGDGHDHGDAAPAANGPALPRFEAVSETFELVGVLKGKQIELYLDRTADNVPVTNAQIELEIGGAKLNAEKHEDAYEVVLAATPQPGVLPITATVTTGEEVDLLVGELDIHEAGHAGEAAQIHTWKDYAGYATSALAVLFILAVIGRSYAAGRQRRSGAVA